MKILQISKYPPIQGGVSAECFGLAQTLIYLGHQVTVLTNSAEVEEEYRVEWTPRDAAFLAQGNGIDAPRVISTVEDALHYYIPKGNPVISKLVSRGLEIIENLSPDVIYSSYLEPYGIVGSLLSLHTGIGHAVSHAGSDVGRLMKSEHLERAYRMVLERACAVITNRGDQIGVPEEKRVRTVSNRLTSARFYPRVCRGNSIFRFGIYGKVGRNKGTATLLRAISRLKERAISVELHALWGGPGIEDVKRHVFELGIEGHVIIDHFLPHWRIPEFIWNCNAILFLENAFPIADHLPLVPLEAFMCGRPVLMTKEIAEKAMYRKLFSKGCFVVVPEPFSVDSLEASMREMMRIALEMRDRVMSWVDPRAHEEAAFSATSKQFDRIRELCACKSPPLGI